MKKNNKKEYGLKTGEYNILFIFVSAFIIIPLDLLLILSYGIKGVFGVFLFAGIFVVSLFMFIGTQIYALYTVLVQLYMSLIYVF